MIFRHLLNMRSHPTWVRGLKLDCYHNSPPLTEVAPYVGAWIETRKTFLKYSPILGRTLRGCVD